MKSMDKKYLCHIHFDPPEKMDMSEREPTGPPVPFIPTDGAGNFLDGKLAKEE